MYTLKERRKKTTQENDSDYVNFFSAVQLVCDKNWWRYHDNKWMAMFALQSTQSKEEKIRNIVTLLSEIAFYCFFSNNCLIIFCILLWIK